MAKLKLFQVLEERGHKQRWLLDQLRKGGNQFSETYLSQVKSGAKTPSRRFIEAVSAALDMPESDLFDNPQLRAREGKMPKTESKGKINVAIIGLGTDDQRKGLFGHFFGAEERARVVREHGPVFAGHVPEQNAPSHRRIPFADFLRGDFPDRPSEFR